MNETVQQTIEVRIAQESLDKLTKQVVDSLSNAGAKAGNQAGNNFGSAFTGLVQAYIAKVSFQALFSQVNKAVAAFYDLTKAQQSVTNALSASTARDSAKLKILDDTNSTLEDQALALGINTDKLYKNVSASSAASGANNKLEAEVRSAKRAVEDQNKAIETQSKSQEKITKGIENEINLRNKQIAALRKETEEKIKLIRGPGYDGLLNQQDSYAIQISQLEQEKDRLALAGDFTFFVEQEITQLKTKKDLVDESIRQIDIQTGAVERSAKTQEQAVMDQITVLRAEMEAKQNQFDIDIEPAKAKLELLKSAVEPLSRALEDSQAKTSGGGGGSSMVRDEKVAGSIKKRIDYSKSQIGVGAMGREDITQAIAGVSRDSKGIATEAGLSDAFSKLTAGGASAKDAIEMLKNYTIAAAGSEGGKRNLDEAVNKLAESFQSEASMLGNANGLYENYSTVIIPKGIAALEKEYRMKGLIGATDKLSYDQLSDSEKARVKTIGTTEVLNQRLGEGDQAWQNYNKIVETGALDNQILQGEITKTEQKLGKVLQPTVKSITDYVIEMTKKFGIFVEQNPDTTLALTALAFGLTAVALVFMAFGGIVALVVGGVLAGVALLKAGWDSDFGGIRTKGEEFVNYFTKEILPLLKPTFEELVLLFTNIWNRIKPGIEEFVRFITNNWGNVARIIKGGVEVIQGALEIFNGLFTGDNDRIQRGFRNMFNGLTDIFKGFANSLIYIINERIIGGIVNFTRSIRGRDFFGFKVPWIDDLQRIPTFAKGGYFTQPTLGIFGEAGDEAILNMNAIKTLGLTPDTVKALNAGGNASTSSQISGSYNQTNTNYNNYSTAERPFSPTFSFQR